MVASPTSPTGDLAHNPGLCPRLGIDLETQVHKLALNPLRHAIQGKEDFPDLKDV